MVVQSRAYPDDYLIEEDAMGQSMCQILCLNILESVVRLLYAREGWLVVRDLTFFHAGVMNSQNLISPDLAVFIGVAVPGMRSLGSWEMRQEGHSAPQVVFEISSTSTWRTDIDQGGKPQVYGRMGVREYFACDPNEPPVWGRRVGGVRVLGWRYGEDGVATSLVADERGWLWSAELDSYVGYEYPDVRLYDALGVRRPTAEEAAQQRADDERQQKEAERRQKEAAQQRADAERQRADAERQRAEAAQQRADEERRQKEAAQQRADEERQQADVERRQKEAAQQRADEERQRADEERQRADEERHQADEERQQKEAAQQRAEQLAALLRAHGIIPE